MTRPLGHAAAAHAVLSVALILVGGVALYAATDRLRPLRARLARRIAVRQHPVEFLR